MECYLQGAAVKACERCPGIESSCKSVWTARRQTGTTSIAAPEPGREHEKVFSALVSRGFVCDWQRPFRPMQRVRSFVNSSTRRRLRQKTESYAGSRYVELRAKEKLLLETIYFRRSRLP